MQTLSTLLRKLGTISCILNCMQNRQVAYCLAKKVKHASQFLNADFQDIADTVADYLAEATPDDFCPEDILRLQSLGVILEDVNKDLHTVQNQVLSAKC